MTVDGLFFIIFIIVLIIAIALILVSTLGRPHQAAQSLGADIGALLGIELGQTLRKGGAAHDRVKDLKKQPRSKFEARIAEAFKKITGKSFPTVYPSWLIHKGRNLELDGYNAELKIAFEAQGPLHTKFFPTIEDYKSYNERLEADRAKLEQCKKHGVHLILVDVAVPRHLIQQYVLCRLFDVGYIKERPENYIPEQIVEPYTNWIYESEIEA